MDNLYREEILDHYTHPRFSGKITLCTHTAIVNNPLCGDVAEAYLEVKQGIVTHAQHVTVGCAISVASASMLMEKIQGMSVSDILRIKSDAITDLLGTTLTPSRLKCALLSLETVQKALSP